MSQTTRDHETFKTVCLESKKAATECGLKSYKDVRQPSVMFPSRSGLTSLTCRFMSWPHSHSDMLVPL